MRSIAHFSIRICAEASQIPGIEIPVWDFYSGADAELEVRRACLSVKRFGMEVKMIQNSIRELVRYGLATGLIEPEDTIYTTNRLLELFGLDELEDADTPITADRSEEPELVAKLESILKDMLDTRSKAAEK